MGFIIDKIKIYLPDQYKGIPCTCLSLGDSRKEKIPLLHGDTVDMRVTDDGMTVSITKIEYIRHERGDKTDICHRRFKLLIGARGQRRGVAKGRNQR